MVPFSVFVNYPEDWCLTLDFIWLASLPSHSFPLPFHFFVPPFFPSFFPPSLSPLPSLLFLKKMYCDTWINKVHIQDWYQSWVAFSSVERIRNSVALKESFFFFLFVSFRATTRACGSSQARGWIRTYTTATAMRDPSHICGLRCPSQQRWILNPLSEARDRTLILMDASQVL